MLTGTQLEISQNMYITPMTHSLCKYQLFSTSATLHVQKIPLTIEVPLLVHFFFFCQDKEQMTRSYIFHLMQFSILHIMKYMEKI